MSSDLAVGIDVAFDALTLNRSSGYQWHRSDSLAGCVEDRVGDRRGDRHDRDLAAAGRGEILAIAEDDVDLGNVSRTGERDNARTWD